VIQSFSLVNTLLSVDTDSFKRQLYIQRYPVIPLAPNIGLIVTKQESEMMHQLVSDYQHSSKLLLNLEYRRYLSAVNLLNPGTLAEDSRLRVCDGEHVGTGFDIL
jgi:phosphatidylinositol kinase/protein kinase (PI-3  family)